MRWFLRLVVFLIAPVLYALAPAAIVAGCCGLAQGADCGPCKCGCTETGSCKCKNCNEHTADPGYKPAAKAVAPRTDDERYAAFHADVVKRANRVGHILIVGGADVTAAYVTVERFPSGFKGLADGVYDCFRGDDGRPMMRARPGHAAPPVFTVTPADTPALQSCPGGRCPYPAGVLRFSGRGR